uniref:Uncharacterized protein n=1 Tax=Oryza sativa subsp. japonica TaxID=39947 RepID=Q2QVM4_ORYSJ|nr:hypothetical protein LOC_Os12g12320 [Oryza sativa Japonica Group]
MARRRSRATDLLVVSQEKFVKVGSRPRKKRDTSSGRRVNFLKRSCRAKRGDQKEVSKNGTEIPFDYSSTSTYNPNDPTKEDDVNQHKNAQAANAIFSTLSGSEFNRVDGIESTKEIWYTLQNVHEAMDSVRESKVEILKG